MSVDTSSWPTGGSQGIGQKKNLLYHINLEMVDEGKTEKRYT